MRYLRYMTARRLHRLASRIEPGDWADDERLSSRATLRIFDDAVKHGKPIDLPCPITTRPSCVTTSGATSTLKLRWPA